MELNYKEFGQGEPIVILHGLFGTSDNWQTIAKLLAENYLVYIIDLRNHGRSPHADAHTYHLMAADLYAFMQRHWIYQATIIGHSMGGKVAMQFALEYPEWVKKLIVVDIAPKKYRGGHESILEGMTQLDLDKLTDRKEADVFLTQFIHDFGERQFILKNLTRGDDGKFDWKINLPVLLRDYQYVLDNIDTHLEPFMKETLFIRGEKSNYIKDTDVDKYIKPLFPNEVLATISNAGHWVHADNPKHLVETVEQFLKN